MATDLVPLERQAAQVWTGHEESLKKAVALLTENGLPGGLLPLEDVIEIGCVQETGFMWITQKKQVEHEFKLIQKPVSYDTEITGYIAKNKITKLKGVKAKELLMWPPVGEITVDEPATGNIQFKSFAGITKTFPVEAFAVGN